MNFDPGNFFLSLVIGGIGFVAFSYGRKQRRPPQVLIGLVLMVYPYFVSNLMVMVGIAVALVLLLWGAIRLGY